MDPQVTMKKGFGQMIPAFREELHRLDQAIAQEMGGKTDFAIQFASSYFGEGVSAITFSYALFLASIYGGGHVMVIEGNIRRPTFAAINGVNVERGLQSVLNGTARLKDGLLLLRDSGISVLPAEEGRSGVDVLASERSRFPLGELIRESMERFRFVLIDGPPVIPFVDAALLAGAVDGVVFVIESNRTRAQVVEHALDKLGAAGARILGTILNKREFHIPGFIYKIL
ncbi:MAG: CpsD/CapB family tyrosine-protein kinase [Deltaproteobacteria bacterium]|nr:CpsD/CapB family tyrosine-protein kinase [Deltaproteobacteria bacterium]